MPLQTDHITRKPLKVIHFGNINGKNTTHLSRRQTVADNLQKSPEAVTNEDIAAYRMEVRRRLGFADADFVFVFVGRIVADKGMTELAQAMRTISSRHPNARLLLVGTMEKRGCHNR